MFLELISNQHHRCMTRSSQLRCNILRHRRHCQRQKHFVVLSCSRVHASWYQCQHHFVVDCERYLQRWWYCRSPRCQIRLRIWEILRQHKMNWRQNIESTGSITNMEDSSTIYSRLVSISSLLSLLLLELLNMINFFPAFFNPWIAWITPSYGSLPLCITV